MKKIKKCFSYLLLSSILIISGCGGGRSGGVTYDRQMSRPLSLYRHFKFKSAVKSMAGEVNRVVKKVPVDRYIAFLDYGKMSLAARYYKRAIKYMTICERRFLNIEGTISIKEEVSAIFTNDTAKEYILEPHEIIMISPYLALSYAGNEDYKGAYIERNRVMNRVAEYINRTQKYWLENPFARYLSAVLYERQGRLQDAKLEYRKILQASKRAGKFKGDAAESLRKLGRGDNGQLVLFIDMGIAPIKKQDIFDKKVRTRNGVLQVKFAYPVMRRFRGNRIKKARVFVDDKEVGESFIIYNLEKVIMTQFKKNKSKIRNSILQRVIPRLLAQAAGQSLQRSKNTGVKIVGALMNIGSKVSMAIERADTRSWLSLPKMIHVFRDRNIEPGAHTIKIEYLDGSGRKIASSGTRKINIESKRDIRIQYFAAPY